MTIHDISITTTPQTVTWDGTEQGFSFQWAQSIGPNTPCCVSVITDGAHTGTHLDAPLHFVEGGRTVDTLDLTTLLGPAQVVEIFGRDTVTGADLDAAGIAEGTERVLIKTDNSRRDLLADPAFHPEYVGVAPSAASWLVAHGVKLIGVDYISVGPYGDANVETHRILLHAGVVVVETLRLTDVRAGTYFLAALPPRFGGLEGSPCRAVLVEGLTEGN